MYIKNRSGPRMGPQGKSQEMSSIDDCTLIANMLGFVFR